MPDSIEKVVAAHDPVARVDQKLQHVEDLGLDRHEFPALAQLASCSIKDEVSELVDHEATDAG